MKAAITILNPVVTLLGLLTVACLQLSAVGAAGQLIIGDTFESYAVSPGTPVRLQTASGSVWTSQTTATVVDDSSQAFEGSQFVRIAYTTSTGSSQIKRTFSSIPASGTYYIQLALYNNFTKSTLDNGTTSTSDDGSVQIRLTDGSVNALGLMYRGRSSTIEFYALKDGTTTFYDTGISYDTSAWREFTFSIDLSTSTADLYYNNTLVLSDIAFNGSSGAITTLDVRTTFLSTTDSLLVDDVGFYSTNPVPEPRTAALAGAAVAFALLLIARKRSPRNA